LDDASLDLEPRDRVDDGGNALGTRHERLASMATLSRPKRAVREADDHAPKPAPGRSNGARVLERHGVGRLDNVLGGVLVVEHPAGEPAEELSVGDEGLGVERVHAHASSCPCGPETLPAAYPGALEATRSKSTVGGDGEVFTSSKVARTT
jgi:hypothetical protein